jgi:uracil-DNA glycosylase
MPKVDLLLRNIKECSVCKGHLPHGIRPILQINTKAKILIAGQAPGRKVHESGVPFDDTSGDRLRTWMGISKDVFYDSNQIAILPMGFCYPGTGKSGDLPPRPECEKTWRNRCLEQLPNLEMTLVLGTYAQAYHFGKTSSSLTELVKSWQIYWPNRVPLPHPSPRNNSWLSKNSWFNADLLPSLQKEVSIILQ